MYVSRSSEAERARRNQTLSSGGKAWLMYQNDVPEPTNLDIWKFLSAARRFTSSAGTPTMTSTSPASKAAVRTVASGMNSMRMVCK